MQFKSYVLKRIWNPWQLPENLLGFASILKACCPHTSLQGNSARITVWKSALLQHKTGAMQLLNLGFLLWNYEGDEDVSSPLCLSPREVYYLVPWKQNYTVPLSFSYTEHTCLTYTENSLVWFLVLVPNLSWVTQCLYDPFNLLKVHSTHFEKKNKTHYKETLETNWRGRIHDSKIYTIFSYEIKKIKKVWSISSRRIKAHGRLIASSSGALPWSLTF